jgi:DNA polymerase III sliding clamp (beta) subunit (PCNA family)
MKDVLRQVRGAVSTKDFIPVLTSFHIYAGRVQGSNGRIAIDFPCPELAGLEVTVKAERFLNAVDCCEGEPDLHITEGGKLTVKKKSFRAYLPLVDHTTFPRATPDPPEVLLPAEPSFVEVLHDLLPFISQDASRPWACGAQIVRGALPGDGRIYATNNVILVRRDFPWPSAPVTLPRSAVDEIVRIGETPTHVTVRPNHITLYYKNGGWLQASTMAHVWPDVEKMFIEDTLPPLPVMLEGAIKKVLPFCRDKGIPVVVFSEKGIATEEGEYYAEVSDTPMPAGRFNANQLLSVLYVATRMDFARYPNPCPFSNERDLRGLLVGMK